MAVKKSYANDIFKIISKIDNQKYNFFKEMDKTQYNELQPYTLLRWISAVDSTDDNIEYTIKTNNIVNNHFFELAEHKDLMLNLLCACGNNKWNKHKWFKVPNAKKVKTDYLRKLYHNLTDEEFKLKLETLTKSDIKTIEENIGLKDK